MTRTAPWAPWRPLVVLLAGCGSLGHGESLDVGAAGEDGGTFSSTDAGQSALDAYIGFTIGVPAQ
jgi:hypothetical protein